ncbi:MAG: hypothetical protein ACE5QV_08035, partial [Fidelibacterota bacterium]
MEVYRGLNSLPEITGSVISVGTFDGLHRGHQIIIETLCSISRKYGGKSILLTFNPHPKEVIKVTSKPPIRGIIISSKIKS